MIFGCLSRKVEKKRLDFTKHSVDGVSVHADMTLYLELGYKLGPDFFQVKVSQLQA